MKGTSISATFAIRLIPPKITNAVIAVTIPPITALSTPKALEQEIAMVLDCTELKIKP